MPATRYVGVRDPIGTVHVTKVTGKLSVSLPMRNDLWNHSPDGPEWGYLGSGPAQLALAILADATGSAGLAMLWHQLYKAKVVAFFAKKGWFVTKEEVLVWCLGEAAEKLCPPIPFCLTGGSKNA